MCWGCAEGHSRHRCRHWLLLLAVSLLPGCSSPPEDPERQIRALIGAAEQAVEARSLQDAAALVSDTYRDPRHHTKANISGLLLGYFHRHRQIHLLVRVTDVELGPGQDRARAIAYVATAGVPIKSTQALVSVRASLYRFDVELLREEPGWRFTGARWRPASPGDFLD